MRGPVLPYTDAPKPGENVRGLVRWLASANGFQKLLPFAAAFGLTHLGPESDDRLWDRLAPRPISRRS